MDNLSFIIPVAAIQRLEGLFQSNENFIDGGLIIVAMRDADHSVTGIRVFLAGWDISDRTGTAKLVIAQAGPMDPASSIRAHYRPTAETTDMQLVMDLRSDDRPPVSYFSLEPNDFINTNFGTGQTEFDTRIPNYYFDLAFIEHKTYKYMTSRNTFYYQDSNGMYFRDQGLQFQVVEGNRGIKCSSALATFRHGVGGISDPAEFTTLIVRPEPEPIIVEINHSGAVAYDIMPTCPPYWKPGAQFSDSIFFLSKSAAEAQAAAIKDVVGTPASPSCLGTLIWIGVVIISLYYAL